MSIIKIILIALALAVDAFAVSVSAGAYFKKADIRQKFRLSFHFGFFQFIMPIMGWFAGSELVQLIADYDHWLAFVILLVIGTKMLETSRKKHQEAITKDISKGLSLISLSIATSIDALAVGFSLGLINENIFLPAIIIGVVAGIMTLVGIYLGERLAITFGNKMQAIGGIVLIAIGFNIVFEHLQIWDKIF